MIIITVEAVAGHNQLEKLDHMLASLQVAVVLQELAHVVHIEVLDLAQTLVLELLLCEKGQRLEEVH